MNSPDDPHAVLIEAPTVGDTAENDEPMRPPHDSWAALYYLHINRICLEVAMDDKKLSDDAKAVVRRILKKYKVVEISTSLRNSLPTTSSTIHPTRHSSRQGWRRKLTMFYGTPSLIFMQIFTGRPSTATW